MREIEVKARLKDPAAFLEAADKVGIRFGKAISQDDTTYESAIPYDNPAWNIFRLREQNGTTILTMKHKASQRPRDNYEYETTVGSAPEIIKILERLGYNYGVHLKKERRIAQYKQLELCLDDIADLGTFVEVEKLVQDDADVDAVQAELWDLLCTLGIDPADRILKGYDTLMRLSRLKA